MKTRRQDDERIDVDDRPLTREEAIATRRAIERRLGVHIQFKGMLPEKRPPTQRELDRKRALALIEQDIAATIARCEALEREVEP